MHSTCLLVLLNHDGPHLFYYTGYTSPLPHPPPPPWHRLQQTMKLLSTNRGRNLVFWYARSLYSSFLIIRVVLPWRRVISHLVCLLWWSGDSWTNKEWSAIRWQSAQRGRINLTIHAPYQYNELHHFTQDFDIKIMVISSCNSTDLLTTFQFLFELQCSVKMQGLQEVSSLAREKGV